MGGPRAIGAALLLLLLVACSATASAFAFAPSAPLRLQARRAAPGKLGPRLAPPPHPAPSRAYGAFSCSRPSRSLIPKSCSASHGPR